MDSRLWQIAVALAFASILPASPARALTAVTWVSGTGDDLNPCTREKPCRTFSKAQSETGNGGQILVLDSGDFDVFEIRKSLTIKAAGAIGGVAVNINNAININAEEDSRVILDGLEIDGGRQGRTGILILKAADVVVRNTTVRNFDLAGIYVNNLESRNRINLTVDNVRINNAHNGIWISSIEGGISTAYVWNSVITGNEVSGVRASGVRTRVEISGNVINLTPESLMINDAVVASYGDNILSDGDAPTPIAKR